MRPSTASKRFNYLDQVSYKPRIELPIRYAPNRTYEKYEQKVIKPTVAKPKSQFLKQQCMKQNVKFKQWAQKGSWDVFHSSHYDWWAFPIDQTSGSKGNAYKVEERDQIILEQDQQFLKTLKQNAILVCKSWGWDLQKGQELKQKSQQQKWQKWSIRLSKMCRSLQIFKADHEDMHNLFRNAISYAVILLNKEKKFTYGGQDLSQYFLEKSFELNSLYQPKAKKQQPRAEEEPAKLIQERKGIFERPRGEALYKPSYSCFK